MTQIDSNCIIFDKFIQDDLKSYTLIENNSNLSISYDGGSGYAVNLALDKLGSYKPSNPTPDIWYPVFITDDNNITNKVLSQNGAYKNSNSSLQSGRLGIENFISFTPEFQNLSISVGNMSIDWILNQPTIPFYLCYGLLGWYKYIPKESNLSRPNNTGTLDKFPVGSRLQKDGQPNIYIKLDDSTLYEIISTKDDHYIDSSSISHYDPAKKTSVNLSDIGGQGALFHLYSSVTPDTNSIFNDKSLFWIADGDILSYFDNASDKNIQYSNRIISNSYISPALYKYYTQIYNIITCNRIKKINSGVNLRNARKAKKLAAILSSSPFITDSHINALNDPTILNTITEYINQTKDASRETDQNSELSSINTIINTISTFYKDRNLESSLYNKTQNNNFIYSKASLFTKLLSKYSANLLMTTNSTITYTPILSNGDSLYINQITENLCDKNLKGTKNNLKPVYNNQRVSLSKLSIVTDIQDQSTNINLNHGNITKILPLADISKNTSYKADILISLGVLGDILGSEDDPNNPTNLYDTDGTEYIFLTRTIDTTFDKPIIVPFNIFNNIEQDYGTFLNPIHTDCAYYWEQLGGPKILFSDINFSGSNTLGKFDTSTEENPNVYATRTGEYSIQCTVSTPYGIFIKKKTFYIVDGRKRIPTGLNSYTPNDNNYKKYSSDLNDPLFKDSNIASPPESSIETVKQDNERLSIPSDYLRVMCPKMSEVAIEKNGLFWPIRTNMLCREQKTSITDEADSPLGGNNKYYFRAPNQATNDSGSVLELAYTTNNTSIKIIKLKLANLRNSSDPNCSNCLSMFRSTQFSDKGLIPGSSPPEYRQIVLRSEKYEDDISLRYFQWNGTINAGEPSSRIELFYYPQITTKNSPPIKTYGGYDQNIREKIGLSIPEVTPDQTLPVISGYNLLYPMDGNDKPKNLKIDEDIKYCYQKNNPPKNFIEFSKGVFHPQKGWIKSDGDTDDFKTFKNLSSVLKYNPGARKSFSFTGPGLLNIKSNFNRTTHDNIPQSYKSSISLSIAPFARWDPVCGCGKSSSDLDAVNKINQLNKEYIDQYNGGTNNLHHGYRYLLGGLPKTAERRSASDPLLEEMVDEFGFETYRDFSGTAGYSVGYSYAFPVCGPANPITQENISNKNFRNPRINNLTIQDIEVKLNFLNYVNTKNLVIWLEMSPYRYQDGVFGECPLFPENSNVNINNTFDGLYFNTSYRSSCLNPSSLSDKLNNTDLVEYMTNLTNLNSSSGSSPLRLCLLNQEHIQHNKYNLNLKFSDHANKFTVPYDQNIFNGSGINLQQNIVMDTHSLSPSLSAIEYSDKNSAPFQNIIRTNEINLQNNSFVKFKNRQLFATSPPENDNSCNGSSKQATDSYDGTTTFTLHIMVLDETDDMRSFDMVYNNNSLSYYDTVDNKQKSPDIINSLCSWELILHTDKTHKYVAKNGSDLINYGNTDNLGLIEYGEDPKYPGYSFIADFTDRQFLLPRANYNAPHTYINDYALCEFVNTINKPKASLLRPPEFPKHAALLVAAGTAATSANGTIIGTMSGPGAMYEQGFNLITQYFTENRIFQSLANKSKDLYVPKYENFPYGSAEKILLNVSKDGDIWYKLEASIFKYKNLPVLQNNKYKFIKLSRTNIPIFSRFSFDKLNNITDIVSSDLIKKTITDNDVVDLEVVDIPSIFNNLTISPGEFIKLNFTTEQNKSLNGLYIIDSSGSPSVVTQPAQLLQSNLLLQNNNLSHLFTTTSATSSYIKIKSQIPYYIFNINDTFEHYTDPTASSIPTGKILGKGLVIEDNQYITILNVNTDVSKSSYISPNTNDSIVVFKPQTTKLSNTEYPISKWSLEKEKLQISLPSLGLSTFGLGSYGDGSPFKNKNILSSNLSNNKLENIYEIFNNHINDKIKYNNMTLYISEKTYQLNNTEGVIGFTCSIEDIKNIFLNDNYTFIKNPSTNDTVLNSILDSLKNSTTDIKDRSYEIIFIKSKTSASPAENTVNLQSILKDHNYGDITFEQDFIPNTITNHLVQSQIDQIVTRINFLETTNSDKPSIINKIGDINQTDSLIETGSIINLEEHYNSLPNDPVSCFTSNSNDCYKRKTKKAIYKRYAERNELLKILETQAILTFTNGDKVYKAKEDNSYILPHTRVDLNTNTDKSLSITYNNMSDNYYWINIDPKQSCSLAEDVSLKILKKTTYTCSYANGLFNNVGLELVPNNNICPSKIVASEGKEQITSRVNSVTYTIPTPVVEDKKRFYNDRNYSWKEYTIERRFMINNDITPDGLPTQDILVVARETYDLAIPPNENFNDGSADINDVADSDCSPPCRCGGNTNGKGLVAMFGPAASRIGKSTRVYNIFNLDNINTLKVQFRKVPRQIRGIDYNTTVHKYSSDGGTFRPLISVDTPTEISSGETLNNNFYCWECLQASQGKMVIQSSIPDFLKLQNEMIYRAFFGSVDGIENKGDLTSQYPWEMIPYEYDT